MENKRPREVDTILKEKNQMRGLIILILDLL